MTLAAPGVLKRPRSQVPFTPRPITILRPVREHGVFIVDAVLDYAQTIDEQKYRANRARSR